MNVENGLLLVFVYNLFAGNWGYAFVALVIWGLVSFPEFIYFAK